MMLLILVCGSFRDGGSSDQVSFEGTTKRFFLPLFSYILVKNVFENPIWHSSLLKRAHLFPYLRLNSLALFFDSISSLCMTFSASHQKAAQEMASQEYQVPDLASVLKTLASFTAPTPQSQGTPPPPAPQHPAGEQSSINIEPVPDVPAAVPAPKLIDPATIIDWSSGLRCVMKTVAAHDNIIKEIRHVSWNLSLIQSYSLSIDDKGAT
jgi:hypothetical protein